MAQILQISAKLQRDLEAAGTALQKLNAEIAESETYLREFFKIAEGAARAAQEVARPAARRTYIASQLRVRTGNLYRAAVDNVKVRLTKKEELFVSLGTGAAGGRYAAAGKYIHTGYKPKYHWPLSEREAERYKNQKPPDVYYRADGVPRTDTRNKLYDFTQAEQTAIAEAFVAGLQKALNARAGGRGRG
jgi:hypothetical protein